MSLSKKIFTFGDVTIDITYLVDEDNVPWLLANPIAAVFGYSDPKKAIRMHVVPENQIAYENIKWGQNVSTSKHIQNLLTKRVYLI